AKVDSALALQIGELGRQERTPLRPALGLPPYGRCTSVMPVSARPELWWGWQIGRRGPSRTTAAAGRGVPDYGMSSLSKNNQRRDASLHGVWSCGSAGTTPA